MMIKTKQAAFCVFGTMILMFSGCSNGQGQSRQGNNKPTPVQMQMPVDQSPSRQVEKIVKQNKNVTQSVAVNSKKDLMVGIKLKTFARFSTLQIVNKLQKSTQKKYPRWKVQVSSDKKIYAEISSLKKKLNQGNLSNKRLNKKMKRIDGFMKDQDPSKQ